MLKVSKSLKYSKKVHLFGQIFVIRNDQKWWELLSIAQIPLRQRGLWPASWFWAENSHRVWEVCDLFSAQNLVTGEVTDQVKVMELGIRR